MAAATVVRTRWGANITGGTDATTIFSTPVRIKAVVVTSVGTAGGIVTLTSVTGTTHLAVLSGGTIGQSVVHNMRDLESDGLIATMGTTGHICNVIVG